VIYANAEQTVAAVAAHYDELGSFYREVRGGHVHPGYWATGREIPEQAAVALDDLLAVRLGFATGQTGCDTGCGYSACARRLAEELDPTVTGVTVSAARAAITTAGGPRQKRGHVSVELRDWLVDGFAGASFDRAYAIESSEHMADKQLFFDEAHRILRITTASRNGRGSPSSAWKTSARTCGGPGRSAPSGCSASS
jgi:tocopherol O-methyltransferase